MTKILVCGANGQLGQSIRSIHDQYIDLEMVFTDIEELDICNPDQLITYTQQADIDYLINCAAYTAVDKAEHEQVMARKLNADAVKNIGIAATQNNFKVIHISTDYVFDGKTFKPYSENVLAVPESFYGQTKLLGEKYLMETQPDSMIIRTAWLYSEFGNNFVKTMIKLGKQKSELSIVADQVGSPTYAIDLAQAILTIITKIHNGIYIFKPGIYHYSNEGVCSWYDFTLYIHRIMGIDCKITPIESKDYPTAAPRPFYSVLNKSKIKTSYKINIPHWGWSLEKCLCILKADRSVGIQEITN
ncbi:dTDP-4-dehydrorhamnose reductase [Saccharicrinis carchari]|uniref:dTDP-4-dehydrorhamnose reductase n=1 Tax=Saccharicrinis carchari TaxID=1168039 RepID=A0A521AQS2_SACCC|nr:dTDP-4-dehydrorhamnose reductase [Saccharicrinis carchari]SMO37111.1 dTDP-4-dehydrorhamnose reductase [Saccharicrinis carchari]